MLDAGANLTGQDRRALSLARALVGKPLLLLVDDIEHCLPAPTAQALQRLFQAHEGTIVYSTHDVALAALADEVWTLDEPAGDAGEAAATLQLVPRALVE